MSSLPQTICIGAGPLTIEDVEAIALGNATVELSSDPDFVARISAGAAQLAAKLERGEHIYGVTTGFGESCVNRVDVADASELARNLVRFHGCGTGDYFDEASSAAIIAVRLASLASGWSGIRIQLMQQLVTLLDRRVLPLIPVEGSVGASGDLTPLSYVAAVAMGEREVMHDGVEAPAAEVLKKLGMQPLELAPKESLAIMNGTSVMTALCCLAFARATRLARWSARITAGMSQAMAGNVGHFDDRIYLAKPHPGQRQFAQWIREDMGLADPLVFRETATKHQGRLQDRYSIRCAPQVVGVLVDALAWMRPWLEIEVNGANDNPLLDPDDGEALHGGNFYGGHACFVADGLKNAVANVADLLDRQLALICSGVTNHGLPENLVADVSQRRSAFHGFKAMQIAASALTAEALKMAGPMSVFSRSTECHNQDKVSMGTIAARESLRILELVERVAAITTLAIAQARDLREEGHAFGPGVASMLDAVREHVPTLQADRRQDSDIRRIVDLHRFGELCSWESP